MYGVGLHVKPSCLYVLKFFWVPTRGRQETVVSASCFWAMTNARACVYTSTEEEEGWNGKFRCHVSKNRIGLCYAMIKKNK